MELHASEGENVVVVVVGFRHLVSGGKSSSEGNGDHLLLFSSQVVRLFAVVGIARNLASPPSVAATTTIDQQQLHSNNNYIATTTMQLQQQLYSNNSYTATTTIQLQQQLHSNNNYIATTTAAATTTTTEFKGLLRSVSYLLFMTSQKGQQVRRMTNLCNQATTNTQQPPT